MFVEHVQGFDTTSQTATTGLNATA